MGGKRERERERERASFRRGRLFALPIRHRGSGQPLIYSRK